MKYLSICFLLILSSITMADTWISGPKYTVIVEGVSKPFAIEESAVIAASNEAERCKKANPLDLCEVILKSADRKVGIVKSSSSSSSAQSSLQQVTVLTMDRPTKYEDGTLLMPSQIRGYELRINQIIIRIPPQALDPIRYEINMAIADTDVVQVAAIATNGLYSDFVKVPKG